MDCKEFEKLIPDFLERKMNYFTLSRFNRHRKECSECHEELVIRFLVSEGIQRLEEGDAFDLQKELNLRLAEAEKKLKRHNRLLRAGEMLEILVILIIAAAVVWILV